MVGVVMVRINMISQAFLTTLNFILHKEPNAYAVS